MARYRVGYWGVAFAFLVMQAFLTVPSPLYERYAERDGFSSLTITLIYAVYAVGVALSLFFAGHLSDVFGRRPLLLVALAIDAASAIALIIWPQLPGLYTARIACGLAAGVTSATATAYLAELYVAHRPVALVRRAQLMATGVSLGGLGSGALLAGVIAEYTGHALTLPYAVVLACLVIAAVGVLVAPETRARAAPLPRYRPQRIAVASAGRSRFWAALVGVGLEFAVFGMFTGLAGTFLTVTLDQTSLALAGFVVFLVFGVGVVVATVTNAWPIRPLLGMSVLCMVAGLALVVIAAWLPSPSLALFLLGGAVIGAGGAALFKGSLVVLVSVSPPARMAESLAAFYLAGYVGMSIPVIGLGFALQHVDPRTVLLGFSVVMALGVLAATPVLLRGSSRSGDQQPKADQAVAR